MCAAGTRTMHVGKRPGTICVLQGLGPCMYREEARNHMCAAGTIGPCMHEVAT